MRTLPGIATPPRKAFGLTPVLTLGLALLAPILAPTARAQFNGPATSTVGPELNRPITLTTDPALLFPSERDQRLSPGDLVQVRIFGQPDYQPASRIGNNGSILLPLIGEVHLAGLSVTEAEILLAHDFEQQGMYRNPQVSLLVTEGPGASVTMIGEMHGVVPIVGSRRLLDVLSAAGGLPPTASHTITIDRPGIAEPIVVDLGTDPLHSALANIPIYAGDTIVIARIGVVYMVGEFKTPGVINLTPYAPLTLMQATALTGGLAFDSRPKDVRIIRTIGDKRTVVKLDANAVFEGKAPDPILQPSDIVFVPQSGWKVMLQQGGLSSVLSAVSVAVTAAAVIR